MFDVRHLLSYDIWCLLLYVMLYNCYQTSDVICCQTSGNSYMTADDCCHITVITCLMSDVWFYMLCHITVVRRLMSNIRCLITVIWCQRSDNSYMTTDIVRHLLSYDCYQTSDVMLCYITVIRRLIAVIWCQTSDNSYMTADVWCQMSAVI